MMVENWADELLHDKVVDYYYGQIKDWYTPKITNKLLPNQKSDTFYLLNEPYDDND